MRITSNEHWNDGTRVEWEVGVREVPLDEDTLSEWYDRDARENREKVAMGANIRTFIVEHIIEAPDEARLDDLDEPIAGAEFSQIDVGDTLVVLMNPSYARGGREQGQQEQPRLINLQDCGFKVNVLD